MYYTTSPEFVDEILSFWTLKPLEKAIEMIQKYVYPNEATSSYLTWNNCGLWKKTVVYKNPIRFSFPSDHDIFIEQSISYKVPVEHMIDIAKFHDSILVDRLKGTVTVRSHNENINILLINLMHEIIKNIKTVTEARDFFIEQFHEISKGIHIPYTEAFLFDTKKGKPLK